MLGLWGRTIADNFPAAIMATTTIHSDAAVIGGGIAGLWLLNVLRGAGYGALLLESGRLGGGQTLASQGLIHGGLKYALGGALPAASEAIAQMPARWRACLAGAGEVDLTPLQPLSDCFHFFTQDSTVGKLAAFFASKLVHGRTRRLRPQEFPAFLPASAFKDRGAVYRLDDFVLDPVSLVERLAALGAPHIHQMAPQTNIDLQQNHASIDLGSVKLVCNRLILAAGAGNDALLRRLRIPVAMQRRPLHQVVVRNPGSGPFFGHCLTGLQRPEPRLTITSHPDGVDAHGSRKWLWSLGGQLATDGVSRSAAEQRRHARRELEACLPWLDWRKAQVVSFRIDRAEPRQPGNRRPDQAFAQAQDSCIVCWPTKLCLAPNLGDQVLRLMPAPEHPAPPITDLPAAAVAAPPWDN